MLTRRAILLSLGLLLSSTATHAAKLNTQELFGTWVGQWSDQTFGTTDAFTIIWEPLGPNGGALVTWHLGGNIFGCGEVGPVAGGLFTGHGENVISAHAVKVNSDDDVFGRIHVKTKGTKWFIRGKNTCSGNGPKSYRAKGTLVGTDFTATMKVAVDGGKDVLTFTLHKVQ